MSITNVTINPSTMNDTMKHHPFGPSKWPAILDCQCFRSDESDTQDASIGSEVHALFAECVRSNDPDLYVERSDQPAVLATIAARSLFRSELLNGASGIRVEMRVDSNDPEYFGTCDLTWRDGVDMLHVLDLKTFHNPGRDYSAQLAGYALCLCCREDEAVATHILYAEDGIIDNVILTLDECKNYRDYAIAALTAKDCDRKPRQCEWCAHCENRVTCPATFAVAMYAHHEVEHKSIERWPDLTPAKKAKYLLLAETVAKWADAVREAAKQDLMRGEVIASPDDNAAWTLRTSKGRSTPRVRDVWAIAKERGVNADAMLDSLSITSSKAVALLASTGLKKTEAQKLVESVSDIGAGSVSMVRGKVEG